jgi:predicted metal-dependent phosphoesterase TrpH
LQLKIDLHVHTIYSYDSLITPKELVQYSKERRLDGVAITDHGRVDSALKIAKETDLLIVPGMEIESLDGHIVALDVQEPVPKGLPASETADKIHEAGGIAVACHPVTFFKGSLGRHTSSRFDAVEVINSSAIPFKRSVRYAQLLASQLELPRVAGSDAHYGPEIGCAHTVIDAEKDVGKIVEAIKKGSCQPFGNAIPLTIRLTREILGIRRRF